MGTTNEATVLTIQFAKAAEVLGYGHDSEGARMKKMSLCKAYMLFSKLQFAHFCIKTTLQNFTIAKTQNFHLVQLRAASSCVEGSAPTCPTQGDCTTNFLTHRNLAVQSANPHDSSQTGESANPHDSSQTGESANPHDSSQTGESTNPHDSSQTGESANPHDSSQTGESTNPQDQFCKTCTQQGSNPGCALVTRTL